MDVTATQSQTETNSTYNYHNYNNNTNRDDKYSFNYSNNSDDDDSSYSTSKTSNNTSYSSYNYSQYLLKFTVNYELLPREYKPIYDKKFIYGGYSLIHKLSNCELKSINIKSTNNKLYIKVKSDSSVKSITCAVNPSSEILLPSTFLS